MREITWAEAIEIAARRLVNMNGTPLYVLFNGRKGDFSSLQSTGILGQMVQDSESGKWLADSGTSRFYLHDGATVWVG